jgi:hypothetical protein
MLRFRVVCTFIGLFVTVLSQPSCRLTRTKLITVEMKWQRGAAKEANRVSLHFQKGAVDCSLNFFESEELRKYIESFGSGSVPVTFKVYYDADGTPSGVFLIRVGVWEANRLRPNERLLATSVRLKPGESFKVNSPGGCFDAEGRSEGAARAGPSGRKQAARDPGGWLLYYILVLLVGLCWLVRWQQPAAYNAIREAMPRWQASAAGEAPPKWRKPLLTAGLIALSLSMLQHLAGVFYEDVFHHDVNHFSERFSILVRVNAGLCLFALFASLFGRGLIRVPLFVMGLILLFFWGISTLV